MLGVDGSPTALERAREKAGRRGVAVEFEIADAFDDRWANAKVRESTYLVTTGEVPAWLLSLQRQ